jgi:hypothetical protein
LSGPAWSNFVYYNVLLSWVAILILPMGGHSFYVHHWTNFFLNIYLISMYLSMYLHTFFSFFLPAVLCSFFFKFKNIIWNCIDIYVCDFWNILVWMLLSERSVTDKWAVFYLFGAKKMLWKMFIGCLLFCSSIFPPIWFPDRNH